jgi:hypothetical protein
VAAQHAFITTSPPFPSLIWPFSQLMPLVAESYAGVAQVGRSTKSVNQDNWSEGRDLKPDFPKFEAGVFYHSITTIGGGGDILVTTTTTTLLLLLLLLLFCYYYYYHYHYHNHHHHHFLSQVFFLAWYFCS